MNPFEQRAELVEDNPDPDAHESYCPCLNCRNDRALKRAGVVDQLLVDELLATFRENCAELRASNDTAALRQANASARHLLSVVTKNLKGKDAA